jgi:hypothetical protein
MWSYSGDPANSDRDQVRFLFGDTDTTDQLLTDAEVDFTVAEHPDNLFLAAAACADAVASRKTRLANKSVGDLSLTYSQVAQQFKTLAAQLRTRAAMAGTSPYAGGISIADKDAVGTDSDRVVPAFKVGLHDYQPEETEAE